MPTYESAIAWIAKHEPMTDPDGIDAIASRTTVAMVSDLFGVDEGIVVQDVRSARRRAAAAPTVRTIADVRRERAR